MEFHADFALLSLSITLSSARSTQPTTTTTIDRRWSSIYLANQPMNAWMMMPWGLKSITTVQCSVGGAFGCWLVNRHWSVITLFARLPVVKWRLVNWWPIERRGVSCGRNMDSSFVVDSPLNGTWKIKSISLSRVSNTLFYAIIDSAAAAAEGIVKITVIEIYTAWWC